MQALGAPAVVVCAAAQCGVGSAASCRPSRRRKAVGDVIGHPPRGGCRPLAGVGRSPEPLEALIGVADQARSERETAAAA
jgi:hypothetical protein